MSDKAKELAEFQGSIAAAITAYGEAAMRFAEGNSTLKEHELIPARRRLERLIDATVPLSMYERVRRERDLAAAELTRLAEVERNSCIAAMIVRGTLRSIADDHEMRLLFEQIAEALGAKDKGE